jgi:hypothetical protein
MGASGAWRAHRTVFHEGTLAPAAAPNRRRPPVALGWSRLLALTSKENGPHLCGPSVELPGIEPVT